MSEINQNVTAKADAQLSQDDSNFAEFHDWLGSEGGEDGMSQGTSSEIIVIEDAEESLTQMSQAQKRSSEDDFPAIVMDSGDDDDEGGSTEIVEAREPVVEKSTKSVTSPTYAWCNKLLLQPKELFTRAFEGKGSRTMMVNIDTIATLNFGRPTSIADAANLLNRIGERKEGTTVANIWKWGKRFIENENPAHAILLAPLPAELKNHPEHKGKDWVLVEGAHRVMIAKKW